MSKTRNGNDLTRRRLSILSSDPTYHVPKGHAAGKLRRLLSFHAMSTNSYQHPGAAITQSYPAKGFARHARVRQS